MYSAEIVLRLLLSGLLGGIIGVERESNNRPAGMRTHVLVTMGASLVMLVSQYGFLDPAGNTPLGDPARLAAQVVSGIGFLGAGTIIQTENRITGLTTAASLWVCACIGLAIGNGFYLGGVITAGAVFGTLRMLDQFEKKLFRKMYRTLYVTFYERPGVIGELGHIIGNHNIAIHSIRTLSESSERESEDGDFRPVTEVAFVVKLPTDYSGKKFFSEILHVEGILSAKWQDGKLRYPRARR